MIRRKRSLKRYQSCKCQTFKHARHLLPAAANDDNDEIGKRGMAFNIPCKVGCDSGIWKFSRRGYFHIERWICSRGSNIVHRNTKQISLKLYCQTLICRRRNGSTHTHAHTHTQSHSHMRAAQQCTCSRSNCATRAAVHTQPTLVAAHQQELEKEIPI